MGDLFLDRKAVLDCEDDSDDTSKNRGKKPEESLFRKWGSSKSLSEFKEGSAIKLKNDI